MKQQLEEPRERGNYRPVERTPEEQARIDKWIALIREQIKGKNLSTEIKSEG